MGKAKPRHRSNHKRNKTQPTGIPSVKDSEEESELTSIKNDDSSILNIIEEIQSSSIEERLCGLQSLISLSEKTECVDVIIKHKILKIVAPFLVDKNSEFRNFTAGVLRNLSASGSVDICERLVKDDIMTPLLALLQQYNDWKPESARSEDTDTLLQVVNILWNLCECDETALKYFNSANLLSILLRCLDYNTVGLDLSVAVCQCLNSVSEDNPTVITALRSHQSDLLSLLTITTADDKVLLLKTLVAGIVLNLNVPCSSWLASVLAVVNEALQKDTRSSVSELSSQLPLDASTPLTSETQGLLSGAQALVDAQTMALEILTNLTTSQDDEMDVESEASLSEGEEEVNGWSETDDVQPIGLSSEVYEGLEKYKLVAAVFSKMESLPANVMEILQCSTYSRRLASKCVRLQCRAFLCFNNLVSAVDVELLGGPHYLYSLVKQIAGQSVFQQPPDDSNSELVEAATAAIRSILIRLASIKFTELGEVQSSDLEVMFNIGVSCEPRVQANVIRIVGTLGVLLVDRNLLVKMAGNYLLESAEKQLALWLTAEALDSLLDVFAEDCTDQVAAEINLVSRLQTIAPRLKNKMRQERRTLGEHYPVVSTVMANLSPFIKYKGARVATLTRL